MSEPNFLQIHSRDDTIVQRAEMTVMIYENFPVVQATLLDENIVIRIRLRS